MVEELDDVLRNSYSSLMELDEAGYIYKLAGQIKGNKNDLTYRTIDWHYSHLLGLYQHAYAIFATRSKQHLFSLVDASFGQNDDGKPDSPFREIKLIFRNPPDEEFILSCRDTGYDNWGRMKWCYQNLQIWTERKTEVIKRSGLSLDFLDGLELGVNLMAEGCHKYAEKIECRNEKRREWWYKKKRNKEIEKIFDDYPSTLGFEKPLIYKINEEVGNVYFLVQNNEIVYIGATTRLNNRINQHRKENIKKFTDVYCIEVKKSELSNIEGKFISKYRPKYNKNNCE